jgi:hypothetical protein
MTGIINFDEVYSRAVSAEDTHEVDDSPANTGKLIQLRHKLQRDFPVPDKYVLVIHPQTLAQLEYAETVTELSLSSFGVRVHQSSSIQSGRFLLFAPRAVLLNGEIGYEKAVGYGKLEVGK